MAALNATTAATTPTVCTAFTAKLRCFVDTTHNVFIVCLCLYHVNLVSPLELLTTVVTVDDR